MFRYAVPPGTIALNLNPNRTSLRFAATLCRPKSDPAGHYAVRIRVPGNYE